MMPINKGEFISLNYTCKVKESGEVVDTTLEEVAKQAGLHKHEGEHTHEHVYEPLLVIVGEGWVPKGVDESLIGMETSDKKSVEISPEKGYGARDLSKVKLLPLRKFTKEGINPVPGVQIEIDRKPALIRSVGAGRVQVDFNHPLAGKILLYDLTVEKIFTEEMDKIRAIIHRRIPTLNLEKTMIKFSQNTVTSELPEEAFFIEGLQLLKRYIAEDLQKYLPEVKTVEFVERFKKAEVPASTEPKSASTPQDKK